MKPLRDELGVTLVEAAVVLAVASILAAIAAPSINGYIDQARQARAREDVQTIGDAINQFITDTGQHWFMQVGNGGTGTPPDPSDTYRVNLLVSDGDIPTLGTGVSTESFWTAAVDNSDVDTLSNHLVENTPGSSSSNRYRNPTDIVVGTPGGNNIDFARTESSGFNAPYSWRGPYLRSPVDPDPWGNRYAVNVGFLYPAPITAISGITASTSTSDYPRMDVFVLSAGPDEEVDTKSAQDGAVPGDDDFIYLVSGHAK